MLLPKQAAMSMLAEPTTKCGTCGKAVHRNYCRDCDEFTTDGHKRGCAEAEHVNHRGYDEHAPAISTGLDGFLYENAHGSYRINTTQRGPKVEQ